MKASITALIACLSLTSIAPIPAATLDTNFQETIFATAGPTVTSMAWAPDGSQRLFVNRKSGEIQIVKNGVLLATNFATVNPIFLNAECGLMGICFDPNFVVNGYVYVFATVAQKEQQIIRYQAVGDIGLNKRTIMANLPTIGTNHQGGGLGIGADGKLYWSIGDNGDFIGVNDDYQFLAAKVDRANLDGSAPPDNPFADGPGGNNDYIWARGFRNPFTLTFQDSTGELWVNVVGHMYEQIFVVHAGDHVGWDFYENNQPAGFLPPKIKYRTNFVETRDVTNTTRVGNVVTYTTSGTNGFRQGEQITISGMTDASFNGTVYVASVLSSFTFTAAQTGANANSSGGTASTLNQGGCVTGGCFWYSTSVPAACQGNFYYGDFNSGRIMRAQLNATNAVTAIDYFATGSPMQIDAAVGPDGTLYYAQHNGLIHRLAYTNYSAQKIIVTPTVVRMVEGGGAAVAIRLATQPVGSVTVNTTRTGGDSGIVVHSGATLSFNSSNWSAPQVVTLAAMADENATNSTATLTIAASGLESQPVIVYALDQPPQVPVMSPVERENGPGFGAARIDFSGEIGRSYVLEASTNLSQAWTPLVTNALGWAFTNYLDAASSILPVRYYRARLAL